MNNVEGVAQDCSKSSALAVESLQSCTKSSAYAIYVITKMPYKIPFSEAINAGYVFLFNHCLQMYISWVKTCNI